MFDPVTIVRSASAKLSVLSLASTADAGGGAWRGMCLWLCGSEFVRFS